MSVTYTGKLCNTSNKTRQKKKMYINFFQKNYLKKTRAKKDGICSTKQNFSPIPRQRNYHTTQDPQIEEGHQTSKSWHPIAAFCLLPIIPLTTLWYFILMMPRMTLSKNLKNLSRTNENLKQYPNGVEWFLDPHSRKNVFGRWGKWGGSFYFIFSSLFAISAAHLYFVTTSGELRSSSFSSLFSSSDIAAFSLSLQKTKIKQKSITLHHRVVVRNGDRRNQMGGC